MKILVLGSSGMLGNAVLRFLSEQSDHDVLGTVRSSISLKHFSVQIQANIHAGIDVENTDQLIEVFSDAQPDVVINCIGLVKQLAESNDPLVALPLNALFPHRLARLCAATGSRLIHISTDCVFSGKKGNYIETDFPDANDLYGRSKLIGEVDYSHAITLRTSIVGHELNGSRSLIDWFLSQEGGVNGFRKAIFSGLPTVEIARVIHDYVLPNPHLRGLYHLSVDPINKYDLLNIVKDVYGKNIIIKPDDEFTIDRSLDSTRFRKKTGFKPKPWLQLIQAMHEFG